MKIRPAAPDRYKRIPAYPVGTGLSGAARSIERILGVPFYCCNRLLLLEQPTHTFDTIFSALAAARRFICIEFYIIRDDETGRRLADLLKKKLSQGVDVYLRYDHFGSFGTRPSFWRELTDAGARVRPSRPFLWRSPVAYFRRNHRKLILIDGEVSFTGGFNIGDEYRLFRHRKKPWRDTGIMMRGPISSELFSMFKATWEATGGERILHEPPYHASGAELAGTTGGSPIGRGGSPIDTGESPVIPIFSGSARLRRRFRKVLYFSIRSAKKSIHLTTAYFTPSRRLLETLEEAVARGVEVNLLLPGRSDLRAPFFAGRFFLHRLLKAGVRIHLYRGGEILHAKTSVFDGTWSILGSANLDFLSMRRNDEGNVGVLDPSFGARMIEMFERDAARSEEITASGWAGRPVGDKLAEWFFALFRRRL